MSSDGGALAVLVDTMTPLSALAKTMLFRNCAAEPATMRIPLPWLAQATRPDIVFTGNVAPGVCCIHTPAAVLAFVVTVPVPLAPGVAVSAIDAVPST